MVENIGKQLPEDLREPHAGVLVFLACARNISIREHADELSESAAPDAYRDVL